MSKVFCIGLAKTGTTSMGKAFEILGYSHRQSNACRLFTQMASANTWAIHNEINQTDAFEDNPWPIWYKWLYKHYPESKFILTVRKDPEVFYDSLFRNAIKPSKKNHRMYYVRQTVYGIQLPTGSAIHKQVIIDKYIQHNNEVMEFFSGKDNFILMCLEQGDGWDQLCPFLGKDIPSIDFPHKNKTS